MDFHSLARRDLQFLCKKNRVPANLTNVAMAKALEALETVEGIEEIQEALGFQSFKINSPDFPHTGRRTSSYGVTHGDKPKIQQQPCPESLGFQSLSLMSPELPHTGRRTSVRRAAFREMTSKEEEEEKNKENPTILHKTPATRKEAKGMEAQSSKRRANKNKEIEGYTETPMAVEAKGGKAIGVAVRRSTRLSSRMALEESRSSSRENSVVKMEPLAKEDTEEHEKEEQEEDPVEYGDSCAVIVEEHGQKDQEAESYEFSCVNGENSKNEVEYAPIIQQQQPSREITQMASEVDDKKLNTRRNTRLSSRKTLEGKSEEQSTVKMVALTEEYAEEKAKQEDKEDLSEQSDSCIVDPVEEAKEKDESIVALVEEVEKNGKKVEIHGFASSTLADDTNNEVENGDSAVVIIEGDDKNDQQQEIQAFTSTTEGEKSNAERKNDDSNALLVGESSFVVEENSKVEVDEPLESTENDCVKDSSAQSPEYEFSEVSGEPLTANDDVEDSGDHSSEAKLTISGVSDSLLCSEMRPLLHEAIVCPQGYSKIDEEEERKLSMLFTEMTLKEPVIPQYADIVVSKDDHSTPDLPLALDITNIGNQISAMEAIRESTEEVLDESVEDYLHKLATNESVDVPQKTEIWEHISVFCAEICSELSTVDSSIEFNEPSGDLPSEISSLFDESIEAELPNSGELTAENSQQTEINGAMDVPTNSSTPRLPCESESMYLEELSTVQTQASVETAMDATETKTKALEEEEVYLKDENLELLSLTKLRAMYKQILNGTRTEERKKSIIKPEDLERLSCIKHDEDCKQKLNDDMIKSESKRSMIKQEDLECLSQSKLDSNKQKLNDDKIKSEIKRTPLKNLNYSTF